MYPVFQDFCDDHHVHPYVCNVAERRVYKDLTDSRAYNSQLHLTWQYIPHGRNYQYQALLHSSYQKCRCAYASHAILSLVVIMASRVDGVGHTAQTERKAYDGGRAM